MLNDEIRWISDSLSKELKRNVYILRRSSRGAFKFSQNSFWVVNMPPDRHALVSMFMRVSCRHSNEICRRTTLEKKMFPQREASLGSRESQLLPSLEKNSVSPWEKRAEWEVEGREKHAFNYSFAFINNYEDAWHLELRRHFIEIKTLLFVEFWAKTIFPSSDQLLHLCQDDSSWNCCSTTLLGRFGTRKSPIPRHNV